MPQAPLPKTLPGEFFVLECSPDTGQFIIHVDDGDGTSYRLGDDIPRVQLQFRLWGVNQRFSDRCIDAAKEFRSAQCIPSQDRVINLIERHPTRPLVFNEQEKSHAAYL